VSLPEVVVAVELWVPVVPELWELVVSVDPVVKVLVDFPLELWVPVVPELWELVVSVDPVEKVSVDFPLEL
jgi:hypothetical protein